MIRIGRLDRRVTIQAPTETRDAAGESIITWAEFKTVWADRRDVRGQERFRIDQRLATRTAVFRIRWFSGVTEKMRLLDTDDSTAWEITGIADDRRKGWMELTCEAIKPPAVTE